MQWLTKVSNVQMWELLKSKGPNKTLTNRHGEKLPPNAALAPENINNGGSCEQIKRNKLATEYDQSLRHITKLICSSAQRMKA